MTATFTISEVAKHNTTDDLWLVIHNKVYNVTSYLDEHPGGLEVLEDLAGQDATAAFEDIGHSDEARELLVQFLVGELVEEKPHKQEEISVPKPKYETVKAEPILKAKTSRATKLTSAALLVGTSVYLLHHQLDSFPSSSAALAKLQTLLPDAKGGSWLGFGTAAALGAVTLAVGAQWVGRTLNVQKDFRSFPELIRAQYRLFTTTTATPSAAVSVPTPVAEEVLTALGSDPAVFQKFPLVEREQLTHNSFRFVFALPTPSTRLGLPIGQHVSIRAHLDGKAVMRSYTPVSNDSDLGRLELVIKVYPGGLITNYLKDLQVGDLVEMRGPKGAMKYHKNLCKHIGMIAGGTGVTPMYQLIRAICEDPEDTTTVSLLYGNQSEDDILLREELESFAANHPEKFKLYHVLNTAPEGWQGGVGFVTKEMIAERLPPVGAENRIMLCGPPPMIAAMKRTLVELGWKKPGPVAKAADQVFCF